MIEIDVIYIYIYICMIMIELAGGAGESGRIYRSILAIYIAYGFILRYTYWPKYPIAN